MSTKYNYDNYTVTVDFKNDLQFSITASDVFCGDVFINEKVELTRIKKDTVIAALSRKSQKNLSCKFQLVDVEPRKLIISFEVSYDFLPTFTEHVSLEQIEKKGIGMNKVESAELRSDIEELENMLNNISCKEAHFMTETSHSFQGKEEIIKKELQMGSYLFEMSGYYTTSSGNKQILLFQLEANGKKYETNISMYSNSGYSYPYALRKEFILPNRSEVKVSVRSQVNYNQNLTNNIITFSPMIKIN